RQALNTVYSLSTAYQKGVDASEYEVVVVENASPEPMDRQALARMGPNIRHYYRDEPGVSPAPALNEAFSRSYGSFLGLMIDGAHMVTPGLLRNVLDVVAIDPNALVTCLAYGLGEQDQQDHQVTGYDEAAEQQLLAGLPYRGDGYRLFQISRFSLSNPNGYAHPVMESNCMFASRENFAAIGQADERFDLKGGGMLNHFMYDRLSRLAQTSLWVLPGEGSFHQFHGGTTTQQAADREDLLKAFADQYAAISGGRFVSPIPEPNYYGEISPQVMDRLYRSSQLGIERFIKRTQLDEPVWDDSPTDPRTSPNQLAVLADAQEQQPSELRRSEGLRDSARGVQPHRPSEPGRLSGRAKRWLMGRRQR
ncbi:glycosyltransferase family 2 protein, partial [Candidatus Nanopelagicales bacterium]|nr:glycosyltransferase family 2 protein [Candidatus Nanopelagicales bacterium]